MEGYKVWERLKKAIETEHANQKGRIKAVKAWLAKTLCKKECYNPTENKLYGIREYLISDWKILIFQIIVAQQPRFGKKDSVCLNNAALPSHANQPKKNHRLIWKECLCHYGLRGCVDSKTVWSLSFCTFMENPVNNSPTSQECEWKLHHNSMFWHRRAVFSAGLDRKDFWNKSKLPFVDVAFRCQTC